MVSPYTSSSVSVVGASGNADIDSLLSLQKWGGSVGTGMTLTYSFPTGGATWDNSYDGREPDLGFAPLSDQEQASVIKALRLWSEVANITFVKANETSVPDKNVGDLRFGKTNMISNDANAGGYLPSSSPFGGDVWLSNTFFDGSDISADGSYKFFILLHEIGHAIGLKHPHEPVDPGSGLGTGITVTDDWLGTTAMSYRDHLNDDPGSVNAGFYPSTPMLNDIRAMQYLYGVNTTTRANSTTYSWEPGERLFETLYDRGGTDTIDWSNQASSAVIRLRAGEWSELGQPYTYFGQLPGNSGTFSGTMMIAPGVDIENANGGAGDDTISGNSAANILRGNGGADWLDGGAWPTPSLETAA
jgi:serralysin